MIICRPRSYFVTDYWYSTKTPPYLICILTTVLGESSTCVSCLHKQIPFVPFLVGVLSNHFGLRRYRPIFVVVRFHRFIHSFQYHSVYHISPCFNYLPLDSVTDSVTDVVYYYVFIPLDFHRFRIKSLMQFHHTAKLTVMSSDRTTC